MVAQQGYPMADVWKNQLYFGDNCTILREHVPDASVDLIYLERLRISFFENPLFSPSLQGEMRGRESLMRGHNRVELGARTWYSHALWQPSVNGATKIPSSRSSAITGSPLRSTSRATETAMCRPLSTRCSAAVLWRRAIPRICAVSNHGAPQEYTSPT